MRVLCFFTGGREPSDLPAWTSIVSDDDIRSRQMAATVSAAGAGPSDAPPVELTSMLAVDVGATGDAPRSLSVIAAGVGAQVACRVDSKVVLDAPVPDGYVKNIGLLRRAEHLTVDGFARYWNEVHAGVALASGPKFFRYATNVVRESWGDFSWDGVVEQWFASREMLARHTSLDAPGRAELMDDITKFMSSVEILVAEPRR